MSKEKQIIYSEQKNVVTDETWKKQKKDPKTIWYSKNYDFRVISSFKK